MIPATPVRRALKKQVRKDENAIQKPFPFLSGKQALFSCARVALLNGIRLLGYVPAKVHVPAYCCKSVLSPIERMGLRVRYYDVSRHLDPIVNKMEFSKGDVFLLVHYFGIPQDTMSINKMCQDFSLVLVEDCAHALPDPETKNAMGLTGAFSIYSLRKQFPVPDGGVLVVNDSQLKEHMASSALPRLSRISIKRWLVTNLDRFAFNVGWPNTVFLKDSLRDIFGSTDNVFYEKLSGGAVPEVSSITAKVLAQADIRELIKIKRKNYLFLVSRLSSLRGVTIPFPSLPDDAVPYAFPIILEEADRVCTFMHKKGIGVGQWPGQELPENMSWSDFPGAFSWVESLVLLPSHQDLNTFCLEKIVRVLEKAI